MVHLVLSSQCRWATPLLAHVLLALQPTLQAALLAPLRLAMWCNSNRQDQ